MVCIAVKAHTPTTYKGGARVVFKINTSISSGITLQ